MFGPPPSLSVSPSPRLSLSPARRKRATRTFDLGSAPLGRAWGRPRRWALVRLRAFRTSAWRPPCRRPGLSHQAAHAGSRVCVHRVGSGQRSTPRATLGTRPAPAVATGREHPCCLTVRRSEPRVGLTGGEPSGQGWLLLEACGGLSPLPLPGPAPQLALSRPHPALSRPHPVTPRPPRGQAPSLGGGPGALVPLAALAPRC